jgi:hypothetical protein
MVCGLLLLLLLTMPDAMKQYRKSHHARWLTAEKTAARWRLCGHAPSIAGRPQTNV